MELQSGTIGELAKALAQVQGKLAPVAKANEVDIALRDGKGKKKYKFAALVDIWQSMRVACSEAGLAVVQLVQLDMFGGEAVPVLVTVLVHTSGEWVRSVCPIRVLGNDAQAFGSAVTYARRYALSAAIGVVTDDEDDDALQASGYPAPQWAPPPPPVALPPPPPPANDSPALPPPPVATGDYVSPPAVAQAEAVVAQAVASAPANDNDTKLANLRATLAQSHSPDVVLALVDEARRILPAAWAETFAAEARPRWEALAAQGAAA